MEVWFGLIKSPWLNMKDAVLVSGKLKDKRTAILSESISRVQ
jgi:hypothetical protein